MSSACPLVLALPEGSYLNSENVVRSQYWYAGSQTYRSPLLVYDGFLFCDWWHCGNVTLRLELLTPPVTWFHPILITNCFLVGS